MGTFISIVHHVESGVQEVSGLEVDSFDCSPSATFSRRVFSRLANLTFAHCCYAGFWVYSLESK